MNTITHKNRINRLHDELQKNGINLSNIKWISGNRRDISIKIYRFEEIAARAARSLLIIRYYRTSILSIIPKDVIRMIAKKIYKMDKKSMISHIKFVNNCEKIIDDRLTIYKSKESDDELDGNDYFNFEGSERNEKLTIYCKHFAGKHWNIIYKLFLGNELYLKIITKIADSYLKNEIPNEMNPIYFEIFERIERHKKYWEEYRININSSEEDELIKYIIDEKKFSNRLEEIKEFLNNEFPTHRNERKKEAEEKEKRRKEEYDNMIQYEKDKEAYEKAKEAKAKAKEAKAKAKEKAKEAEKERKEQYIQYQKKLKAEAEEDEKAEKAENEHYRQKLKRKKNIRRKEKAKRII